MAAKVSSSEKKRKYRSLLRRDGDLCFWCDLKFSEEWPYTIDHLIAQVDGGTNRLENMVLSCDWCNNRRGSMPAGKFKAYSRQFPVPPEDRSRVHLHPNQVAERSNRKKT
jgi:5-methylcytosine-specific restriction endonuclease McrA